MTALPSVYVKSATPLTQKACRLLGGSPLGRIKKKPFRSLRNGLIFFGFSQVFSDRGKHYTVLLKPDKMLAKEPEPVMARAMLFTMPLE